MLRRISTGNICQIFRYFWQKEKAEETKKAASAKKEPVKRATRKRTATTKKTAVKTVTKRVNIQFGGKDLKIEEIEAAMLENASDYGQLATLQRDLESANETLLEKYDFCASLLFCALHG